MKIHSNPATYYWIFGILVVICLLILGVFILFSSYFQYIPSNFRFMIGFFIIAYGAFRLVNTIIKYKNDTYEDDEE
jgi:uncharacterized membrane protein HdeD (DUF308 family)